MTYRRRNRSGMGSVMALAMLASASTLSCGGSSEAPTVPSPTAPVVVSVSVTPSTAPLVVGDTIRLGATARDANGAQIDGRSIAWSTSAAAVATVSSAGTVTALGAGTADIRASIDGVTGSATVTVSPVVQLDETRQVTQTVTIAGDSISTVAEDGATLTLVIPPDALPDSTPLEITVTPVTALASLPSNATLLYAVQVKPSGTQFRRPLLLHIEGPVGVPGGDVLFGFTAPDSGGPVSAIPARATPSGAELLLAHFSLIGLGVDVPEELQDLDTGVTVGLTGEYLGRLTIVFQSGVDDNAMLDELIDIFREWWVKMEPFLTASSGSDQDLVTAIEDYSFWTATAAFAEERLHLPAGSISQAPQIKPELSHIVLLKLGFNAAIERADTACVFTHDLSNVRVALFWQDQAAQLGFDDPDFEWLQRDWVVAHLCARVVVTEQTYPQNPVAGVAADLTLRFGVLFNGQTPTVDMPLPFGLTILGSANDGSIQAFTDATGRYTTSVIPQGGVPLEMSGQACLPPEQVGTDDLCTAFDILRGFGVDVTVSPAVVTVNTGDTQQFTASVTGSATQDVTWSATGGNISPSGLYTAGGTPGTYLVRATSVDDTTAFAHATVTIPSPPPPPPPPPPPAGVTITSVTGDISAGAGSCNVVRTSSAFDDSATCSSSAGVGGTGSASRSGSASGLVISISGDASINKSAVASSGLLVCFALDGPLNFQASGKAQGLQSNAWSRAEVYLEGDAGEIFHVYAGTSSPSHVFPSIASIDESGQLPAGNYCLRGVGRPFIDSLITDPSTSDASTQFFVTLSLVAP